jgi:hypothetical protein
MVTCFEKSGRLDRFDSHVQILKTVEVVDLSKSSLSYIGTPLKYSLGIPIGDAALTCLLCPSASPWRRFARTLRESPEQTGVTAAEEAALAG